MPLLMKIIKQRVYVHCVQGSTSLAIVTSSLKVDPYRKDEDRLTWFFWGKDRI